MTEQAFSSVLTPHTDLDSNVSGGGAIKVHKESRLMQATLCKHWPQAYPQYLMEFLVNSLCVQPEHARKYVVALSASDPQFNELFRELVRHKRRERYNSSQ